MNQNNIDELYHHGILGMKWGVRRYQNKDGSLTPAGRKKAAKLKDKYLQVTGKKLVGRAVSTKGKTKNDSSKKEESDKKSVSEMSLDELKEKTNRLNTEKSYYEAVRNHQAVKPTHTTKGKAAVEYTWDKVIKPAATNAGQRLLEDWLKKVGDNYLGTNTSNNQNNNNKNNNKNNKFTLPDDLKQEVRTMYKELQKETNKKKGKNNK